MKLFFTTLIAIICFSLNSWAQAPQSINYQAVARGTNGNPITTGSLSSVEFKILQGSPNGTSVFSETHLNVPLSPTGLFNLKIGSIDPAEFSAISWASGAKYLQVIIEGNPPATATEMLSVPYALYAASGVGTPGQDGADGVGIVSTVNNGNGTYTFHYSNGEVFTTGNLTGPAGANGMNGTNGLNGANGVGIISTVNNGNGTYTFNYSNGTSFTTGDLTGPAGTNGTNGMNGANGVGIISTVNNGNGTYTFNYSNNTNFTTSNLTGPQGIPGIQGQQGIPGPQGVPGPQGLPGATNQIAIIEYRVYNLNGSSPGSGQTTNAGQWNKRILDTVPLNQIPDHLEFINGNDILRFQPGQYLIRAFGVANYCDGNVLRFRNTLTNVDEIYGTPGYSRSPDVDFENSYSYLEGVINVTDINSQYVLEHWIQTNPGGNVMERIFGDYPNTPVNVPCIWSRIVVQKIN